MMFFILALTVGIAAGLSRYLSSPRAILRVLDHPNARSLHDTPISCTGGIAILVALVMTTGLAVLLGWFPNNLGMVLTLLGGGLFLSFVSFWDDLKHFPAGLRLIFHFLGASTVLSVGLLVDGLHFPLLGLIPLGWVSGIFTLLFVVWLSNLYNFMDGMDGFAGGMGFFGFSFLGIFAWLDGSAEMAFFAATIAAANFGFLILNFPPARIFMGDVGSIPMGFLAAGLALALRQEGTPIWMSVIVFSPFIFDATFTLFHRILKKEPFWRAHRSHLYQRLVLLGWSHKKTVLVEYFFMFWTGSTALILKILQDDTTAFSIILFWLIVFCVSAWRIFLWEQIRIQLKK